MQHYILESLAELGGPFMRVIADAMTGDKDKLEHALRDAFGAEFGDTVEAVNVLGSVKHALEKVT